MKQSRIISYVFIAITGKRSLVRKGGTTLDKVNIWFLNVGHGDCAYLELPNGSKMMIDCGGGADNWPSRLLKHFRITKKESPVNIPGVSGKYALDNLVISHPHGDHISDIEAIHDEIGFYLFTGGYRSFIDKISLDQIDYHKRGQNAGKKFIEIVKKHKGDYEKAKDRVRANRPTCVVASKRFINYQDNIDLNEISYFVSISIGNQKVLFPGDMTAAGVKKILESDDAVNFKEFVKGTTILKVPHHGRENGCSQEMFNWFKGEPILCILSDQIINEKNQGTTNTQWYTDRTSKKKVKIDGKMQDRYVLTTRKDHDINVEIASNGSIEIRTKVFDTLRGKI